MPPSANIPNILWRSCNTFKLYRKYILGVVLLVSKAFRFSDVCLRNMYVSRDGVPLTTSDQRSIILIPFCIYVAPLAVCCGGSREIHHNMIETINDDAFSGLGSLQTL